MSFGKAIWEIFKGELQLPIDKINGNMPIETFDGSITGGNYPQK